MIHPLVLLASSVVPLLVPSEASVTDAPHAFVARGFVVDSSHPKRPFDERRVEVQARIAVDPELGEIALELVSGEGEGGIDRYFVRRGRIFQTDASGAEVPAADYGDVSAAALAALHPAWIEDARRWRRANVFSGERELFAANDVLWRIESDAAGRIASLERSAFDEQFGDDTEVLRFARAKDRAGSGVPRLEDMVDASNSEGAARSPELVESVSIVRRGREIAHFEFDAPTAAEVPPLPAGERPHEAGRVIAEREIALTEIAPHAFSIDLAEFDSRIFVFEFADHLIVYEGAYSSSLCDPIARVLERRFAKPVRYFFFSHLHPQYVSGVRSWIHAGATVLVPPTTEPLIHALAAAPFTLRPDALAGEPVPARVETIAERRHFEDEQNELDVYNVVSDHTDEYLICHLPRAKLAFSGDLLFYRPDQPVTGRSKLFHATLEKLGLDYERIYCTWPLTSLGTKNVVEAHELRAAAGQ